MVGDAADSADAQDVAVDINAQANIIYRLAHTLTEGELFDLVKTLQQTGGRLEDEVGRPLFDISTTSSDISGKLSSEQGGRYFSTNIGTLTRLFGKQYGSQFDLDQVHRISVAERRAGTDIVSPVFYDPNSRTEFLEHMGDNTNLLELWADNPEKVAPYISMIISRTYDNNNRRNAGKEHYAQHQGVLERVKTTFHDIFGEGDFSRRGKRWIIPDRTLQQELFRYLTRYNENVGQDVFGEIPADLISRVVSSELKPLLSPLKRRIIHGDNKLENLIAVIDDESGYIKNIKQTDINEVRWGYDFEDVWTALELHGLPSNVRAAAIDNAIINLEIPAADARRFRRTPSVEEYRAAFDAIGFKEKFKYALKYSEYARNPERHPDSVLLINSKLDSEKGPAEVFADLRDLYFNSALADAKRLGMVRTVAALDEAFEDHPDIAVFAGENIEERLKIMEREYTLSTRPASTTASKIELIEDITRMLQQHYDIRPVTLDIPVESRIEKQGFGWGSRILVTGGVLLAMWLGMQWYNSSRQVQAITAQHAKHIELIDQNQDWFAHHTNIFHEYHPELVRQTPVFKYLVAQTGSIKTALGATYLELSRYDVGALIEQFPGISTDSLVKLMPEVVQAQLLTRDGDQLGGGKSYRQELIRKYSPNIRYNGNDAPDEDSIKFFDPGRDTLIYDPWRQFNSIDEVVDLGSRPEWTDLVRQSLKEWEKMISEICNCDRDDMVKRNFDLSRYGIVADMGGIDSIYDQYILAMQRTKERWKAGERFDNSVSGDQLAALYDNSETRSGYYFNGPNTVQVWQMQMEAKDLYGEWARVHQLEEKNYLPKNFMKAILVAQALLDNNEKSLHSGLGVAAVRHSLIDRFNSEGSPHQFDSYRTMPSQYRKLDEMRSVQAGLEKAMLAYSLTHDVAEAFAVYISGIDKSLGRTEQGILDIVPEALITALNPTQKKFVTYAIGAYTDLNNLGD